LPFDLRARYRARKPPLTLLLSKNEADCQLELVQEFQGSWFAVFRLFRHWNRRWYLFQMKPQATRVAVLWLLSLWLWRHLH